MSWVRIGDTAHSDRKLLRAQHQFGEVRGLAVWGFTTALASWSAQHTLDGWVSESQARKLGGADDYVQLVKQAQTCGFLARGGRVKGPDGERGWLVVNDDPELLHIRTREEVERDRNKTAATRQVEPKRLVRLRDGDQCRYCAKTVSWRDRVSARGGTYDHPEPADRDTFVVACFGCNRTKGDRTAEQWHADGGHQLQPPPDQPLIGADTAAQFGVPESHPPAYTVRPGSQPDTAHDDPAAALAATTVTPAASDPAAALAATTAGHGPTGPDLSKLGVADLPASGRAGAGPPGTPSPPSRAGPGRPRRKRARRGQPQPVSPADPERPDL